MRTVSSTRSGAPVPPWGAARPGRGGTRRGILAGGLGGAVMAGLAGCGSSSTPPGERLARMDDVPQPTPATTPESEAPDDWTTVTYNGVSFSLPATFEDPSLHDDWGIYQAAYDLMDGSYRTQRVLVSGVVEGFGSADGVRQTVGFMNSGLIENYSAIETASWDVDDDVAVERIAFYWGPEADRPGWTWMVASSSVGVAVVSLFGDYCDDGLRNGIEDTLSLDGGQ